MRRIALSLFTALTFLPAPAPAQGQGQGQPPHAALFGTWTGGLFPVPSTLTTQACLSQPVVIFTRDLVLRATLTEQQLTQREIETVRVEGGTEEFRFRPIMQGPVSLATGLRSVGFGCESPDALHVLRRGENEITFPNCSDFPNPLVRCR